MAVFRCFLEEKKFSRQNGRLSPIACQRCSKSYQRSHIGQDFSFLANFSHCNSNWQNFGPLNPSTVHRIFWFTFTFDLNLFYGTFRDNKSVWMWQPHRKDILERLEKWIARYIQPKYIVLLDFSINSGWRASAGLCRALHCFRARAQRCSPTANCPSPCRFNVIIKCCWHHNLGSGWRRQAAPAARHLGLLLVLCCSGNLLPLAWTGKEGQNPLCSNAFRFRHLNHCIWSSDNISIYQ